MKKKKVLLLACIILSCGKMAWSQRLSRLQFRELSLEDQVRYFFDYYKDGHTYLGVSGYAELMVKAHGDVVIPYLKEYLKYTDYFSLHKNPPEESNPDFHKGEPNDITLTLIASVWQRLNLYDDYVFSDTTPPYTLDEGEIQWFVSEYKRRIDEYIMTKRVIDETVLSSEIDILAIAGYDGGAESITKYGHPHYDQPVKFRGNEIKEYYEKRLGITGLKVVPPFTEE
jgi:hypothetical protein